MSFSADNPESFVRETVQRFVSEHPENGTARLNGVPYFENPLVGIADAHDPLFLTFKDIIGNFHLTPVEVLEKSFPEESKKLRAKIEEEFNTRYELLKLMSEK